MISNLVSNGLLHGDPASPVTVRALDRGGDALIVVHNRGGAIAAPELSTISIRSAARRGPGRASGSG